MTDLREHAWALGDGVGGASISARVLRQDYDHNNFKWDVTMHGPVLGAVLRF